MIDLILFRISCVYILWGHTEDLRQRDQKVKQVDHFDLGILLVKLLILRPPLPWHRINEFRHFLLHRPRVV